MRLARAALSVVVGAALAAAPAAGAADVPPPVPLRLSGIVALEEAVVREAAGRPPSTWGEREAWAAAAVHRVVAAYQSRQYRYARAWFQLQADGGIRIHVDEGHMRVSFTGVRGLGAIAMRVGLYLPNDTYHLPTLMRSLDELKRTNRLLHVYHRVREPGEIEITPFNDAVPRRVLQVFVVTREKFGWDLEVRTSPTWGLLVALGYERHLFWRDDRLRLKVEFAFPYRRYALDSDPSWQWVRGGLDVTYRFPRLVLRLAPRVDESVYVSHYDRHDLGIPSYYLLRSTSLVGLALLLPSVEVALSGGVDYVKALWLRLVANGALVRERPGDMAAVRGLGRLAARFEPGSKVMRHDYRSFVQLRFDGASSDTRHWLVDGEASTRLFASVHRHRFIVRAHGRILAGDVRFWDEAALAGDYQRVYFGNRYWVRRALQVETAYRINSWWEAVDFGVFHDFSFFADRTRPNSPAAWVNAFGPSVHVLLFDMFALDLYSGFGFSPKGFGNTVSFNLETVF